MHHVFKGVFPLPRLCLSHPDNRITGCCFTNPLKPPVDCKHLFGAPVPQLHFTNPSLSIFIFTIPVDGRQLVMLTALSPLPPFCPTIIINMLFDASWCWSGLVHVLRKATVPNNSPYRNKSQQIPLEALKRA